MLLVDATVGPSAIQGLGLIANEFLPAGTKIWVFKAGFDLEFSEADLQGLSPSARWQFLKYSYLLPETGTYILCSDDARFVNHSDAANTHSPDDFTYAKCDIHPGEEITSDYREFDVNFRGVFPRS